MTQMNLSTKQNYGQKRTNVVAKGVGVEEGWSGRLGLADVSFYI